MDEIYHPSNTKLIKRLGTGSHASVYVLERKNKFSAFKLFHKSTPEILKSATKEFKFLSYMSKHRIMQNFVPYPISFETSPLSIEMELITGETLNIQNLTIDEFNLLEQSFYQFLTTLHTNFGLIYRDISPRNIIKTDKNTFIFIDFEQITEMNQPYNSNFGTPKFAAISEIAKPADDLFSAGLILASYYGELPWGNLRKIEQIQRVKKECIVEWKKYFGFLEGRVREWVCGVAGEGEAVGRYVDYRGEFKEFEGI